MGEMKWFSSGLFLAIYNLGFGLAWFWLKSAKLLASNSAIQNQPHRAFILFGCRPTNQWFKDWSSSRMIGWCALIVLFLCRNSENSTASELSHWVMDFLSQTYSSQMGITLW
jgi:hypothetical protein